MTVYRVEERTSGKGPWNADYEPPPWWLDASQMPTPTAEDIMPPDYEGHLAFPSMEKLHYWFSARDREYLREHGFVMREYEVSKDDTHCSPNQCVYRVDTAKLLAEHQL